MTQATGTSKAAEPKELQWDPGIIPPFPAIALKALKLMSGTDTSLLELCNLIRSDPAFSIAVLRIANSPLVAFPKNVTSVLQASMLLGFRRLRSILITVGLEGIPPSLVHTTHEVVLASQPRLRDYCRAKRKMEFPG